VPSYRLTQRDAVEFGGDVIGRDRLHEGRTQADRVAVGAPSAILPMNSKNCVARRIVWGTVAAFINFS
jgi:hypothetical protein